MFLKIKTLLKNIFQHTTYLYIFVYFFFLLILSIFRNASGDETLYLQETLLISELIKNGQWIGDYGVGLHGVLFKIPVALSFIIMSQPSVFLATLFTIVLSVFSLILCYKITKKVLKGEKYAFWTTVLLSVALHFINMSLSFNRDIPALFSVLLFIYLFLNKSNKWLLGISLLLMLDAKEHVFFTIAPFYGVYLLIEFVLNFKKTLLWSNTKEFFIKIFSGYILPLIWIVLMFTSSIVPVNMFVASILGLTEIGLEWNKNQFSTKLASQNLLDGESREVPKLSQLVTSFGSCELIYEEIGNDLTDICPTTHSNNLLCKVGKGADILFSYIGKTLYPRTFSFISIPKIIALPAIIHALSLFTLWWRKKEIKYILPLLLLFNVLAIILRASHGRYLLSVAPLFMLFFVSFIKDGLKRPKYFGNTLIATTAFVLLGLLFESSFVTLKIILEVSLLIIFWSIWFLRDESKKVLLLIKSVFLIVLSMGMLLTALAFSYKIGQISNYIKYGYNKQTKEIMKELSEEERIWINNYDSGDLINVYRKNLFNEAEWNWRLPGWMPKKHMLKTYGASNTFTSTIEDMESFKKEVEANKIDKVVLVVSMLEKEEFPGENRFIDLLSQEWLRYERKVDLKNKIVYIFQVEN